MSIWDNLSNATAMFGRRPSAGGPPPGGGRRRDQHWLIASLPIAVVVGLVYIVYSGLLQEWLDEMARRLLALLVPLTLTLVLVAVIAFLVGWALMKMPQGHFLTVHGKRLIWVSPIALVVGASIVPIALIVLTMAQKGASQMASEYLQQRPAANLCEAVSAPPPAVVSPAPRGR